MANRIMLNQTSYHGAGAIMEIANEAKSAGFKKAFVCSDPDLIKFNVTSKVTDILDANGLAYEIYSDIKANPTIENVQNGVAAFKKSGADYIVAIGGGSSMDTAKAIGIIIANPEFEDVRSLEGRRHYACLCFRRRCLYSGGGFLHFQTGCLLFQASQRDYLQKGCRFFHGRDQRVFHLQSGDPVHQ